ncbi:MAG: ParB/RepB/Spo0J family partition protein [Proteobacteria bacterium]|nr:ParB/RepB/Spo0J family partition protein [Pseudomonadota bacterium]MBU4010628.1 ParB/RepB/Spo0J family partition protein [Pseudomonadota bacterium]
MICEEKAINLSSVFIKDDTYKISIEENTDALARSINSEGIINPPILIGKNSGYSIVSGFRRINAIKSLGWVDLTARVLCKKTSDHECVKLAISDNSFQRPLNIIEYSRCYKMLSCYYNEEELPQIAFLLGLADNPDLIKKIMKLCELPISLQKYILSDTLSLAMALELAKPEYNKIGLIIADIFDQLKLSLNKQREFLALCYEIGARENITIADLVNGDDFRNVLSDENLDRNQKTRIIRGYLKKRRFPSIIKAESEFKINITKLGLIEGVKLIPPANFEGNSFSINMEFKKITELNKQTAYLNRLIKNPELQKILLKDI